MKFSDLLSIRLKSSVMIFVFLFSCQSEENVTPVKNPLANVEVSSLVDLESQIEYARIHLTTLAKTALRTAKDTEFKNLVYDEVAKQFDGDFDVLFKTLATAKSATGIVMEVAWS